MTPANPQKSRFIPFWKMSVISILEIVQKKWADFTYVGSAQTYKILARWTRIVEAPNDMPLALYIITEPRIQRKEFL